VSAVPVLRQVHSLWQGVGVLFANDKSASVAAGSVSGTAGAICCAY